MHRLIVNGELVLAGVVLSDEQAGWMWEEDVYFCPRQVREALAELGEGRITVRLNSGGGNPTAGESIRSILAGHPGGTRIVVEGWAASAASLLYMAGTRREMTAGSFLMIHNPSQIAWGTAGALRKAADVLELMEATYAAVYAEASGQKPAAVRRAMADETWYNAKSAIAAGYADALDDAPADAPDAPAAPVAGMAGRMADAGAARIAMADHVRSFAALLTERAPANSLATAAGGPVPAAMATTQEASMPDPISPAPASPAPTTPPAPAPSMAAPTPPAPPAPPVAPEPAAAPAMDAAGAAQAAVAAERARVRAIREMAAPFQASGRVADSDVTMLIDDGTSAEAAGQRLLTAMAAAEPLPSRRPATISRDETDTRLEGMIGALMGQAEGPAVEFRGLRLRSLAMHLAGPRRGFNDNGAIRAGMMSTTMMGGALGVSDFAYVTTEVMNRSLLGEYQRRSSDWTAVTGTPLTASDFRELHAVRFGGDFQLKKVLENGEYQEATLADEAEGLKVERRGRTINITFEAIVNDDMGAFARIPREFAMAARLMESSMVWALIRSNATLKSDGLALFHATHKNLAGSGAVISIATVAAARKAMWEQRAFGSKDPDDFIMATPDRLIVPPAIELAAFQFVAPITPATDATVNPWKATLTPIAVPQLGAAAGGSDTAWYLVSSDMPPIAHAYLDGYQAPTVQTIEGMNPDKVTMNARHIFGAAATEYRGAYKNAGA